jgi:hypothetical protein
MDEWWNILRGETEVLGEKPATVPLCPPQISRSLDLYRTRSTGLIRVTTGRRFQNSEKDTREMCNVFYARASMNFNN